ncbi:MAG: hypothetical protein EOO17_05975 [Chloroflexi bacterium]|nr:MAG: hypothetical protein EOO17_05975 [Chloroflexota bacterium]
MPRHSGMISTNLSLRASFCFVGVSDVDSVFNKAVYYAYRTLHMERTPSTEMIVVTSLHQRLDCVSMRIATATYPDTGPVVVDIEPESSLTVGPYRFNVTQESIRAMLWFCDQYNVSCMTAYNALFCFGANADRIMTVDASGSTRPSELISEKFPLPVDFHQQLKRHHVPEQAISA